MAKVDLKKERKHLYNPSAKQASVLDLAHASDFGSLRYEATSWEWSIE